LVIADFTQMELVIAAVIAGEEVMLDAFRHGVDVHKLTASLVTGTALDSVDKDQRRLAKAVNFGLLYGQGVLGFQRYAKDKYGIELSTAEAEDLRNRFFEAYPALVAWHQRAKEVANGSATEVRTALGRVQYVELGEWWRRFTALLNHPVQGGGADVTKRVMVALADRLKGKARIVNVVHDEFILETEDANAEYVKKVVAETMVEMTREIYPGAPRAAEVSIGKSWADKH
jgi:DNA polymerase I-like protein with 3'-5' exonuclease and polymerase domains